MQRQIFSIGSMSILVLVILLYLVWAPAAPKRAEAAPPRLGIEAATALPGVQVAPPLKTATPWPAAALRLEVHVEANANGEGSAHVVASSQGGQALAHIDTKGQASGRAAADAPALPGCTVCGDAGPLAGGDRRLETGDWNPQGMATQASGQVVILVEANLRSGPSLGSVIVGGAHIGERYAVMERSADQMWWRVCCLPDNRPAWLYAALAQWVDPGLPLSALATVSDPLSPFVTLPPPNLPQGGGTVTPTPMATPTPTALPFGIIEQEQHSEANYATLYVWVQDGLGVSLEGYRLLVTKDGAPLTVGAVRSTAYRQGTTRPSAPGGPEDKAYNLKLAFDPRVVGEGFTPVGGWAVQLIDPQGQPAAPSALFALRTNDDHMEMYLNYGRR